MLAVQLPVVRPNLQFGEELDFIALSLAQLAYYADADIPARTNAAFNRSWKIDHFVRVPKVPNGRPGFLICPITEGDTKFLFVAIQGTTQLLQWIRYINLSAIVDSEHGVQGQTYQIFKMYAEQIKAILDVQQEIIEATTQRNWRVIFTGHSLGGAIAHFLTKWYATQFPNTLFSALGFASPRVGNWNFEIGWPRNTTRKHWYTRNDPIDFFPCMMPTTEDLLNPVVALGQYPLIPVLEPQQIDPNGLSGDRNWLRAVTTATQLATELGRDLNTDSLWRSHFIQAYRMAFSNRVMMRDELFRLRFLHLEYPDNNSWGANFRVGNEPAANMLLVLDPPPADQAVPPHLIPNVTGQVPLSMGGDWSTQESAGSNGNLSAPIPRQNPFVRRQHRPIGGVVR